MCPVEVYVEGAKATELGPGYDQKALGVRTGGDRMEMDAAFTWTGDTAGESTTPNKLFVTPMAGGNTKKPMEFTLEHVGDQAEFTLQLRGTNPLIPQAYAETSVTAKRT